MPDPTTPDVLSTDHARGCRGREYECTCGYDDAVTAEIERLRAVIKHARDTCADPRRLRQHVCKLLGFEYEGDRVNDLNQQSTLRPDDPV
jgi:hypothetical protein